MTAFDWNNAGLAYGGERVDGTYVSVLGSKWNGRGTEVRFTATGTDCSMPYLATADLSVSVQVDGGSVTTPTLVHNTTWQTGGSALSLFSGLSDTAHTVVVKLLAAGQTQFYTQQTGFVTVTGASPALALPTGYSNAQTRLSASGVTNYVQLEGGQWTTSNQQSYTTNWYTAAWTDGGIRFKATITDLSVWAYGDGMRFRLYVDGVLSGSTTTVASDSTWNWRTVGSGLDGANEHEYIIQFVKTGSGGAVYAYSLMTLGGTGINTATLAARDKWAFYGDSITACSNASLSPQESWQGYAYKLSVIHNVQCANRGVGSSTVHQFASGIAPFTTQAGEATTRVTDITNASPPPKAVVILYGTNDLAQIAGAETTTQFQTSYTQMLTRLIAGLPGATVLYCLGILNRTGFTQSDIDPWNAAIQASITAASGTAGSDAVANGHLRYISMNGVLTPASDEGDGLHPNNGGYDKIVTAFESGILIVLAPAYVGDDSSFAGFVEG